MRVLICIAITITSLETSAFAADANNGERLALRWCSPCHAIASNPQGTVGEAPPFSVVARQPSFDAGRLALFLLNPHPVMPNMALSRTEAGDLAAFIETLRNR